MAGKKIKALCLKHSECSEGYCNNGECDWPREKNDRCMPGGGWQGTDLLRCDEYSRRVVTKDHELSMSCQGPAGCKYTEYCNLSTKDCEPAKSEGARCNPEHGTYPDGPCADGLACIWVEGEGTGFCRKKCFLNQSGCPQGQTCAPEVEGVTIGVCIANSGIAQGQGGQHQEGQAEPEAQDASKHQEKPPQEDKPGAPPKDSPKADKEPETTEEVEEEVEEVEPATGKKKKKLVKKRKPIATPSTTPPPPVKAIQTSWAAQLGLPNMTSRELAIYGSIAGAALLLLILLIVGIVLSCKRRRHRSKSITAADGLNQQALSATDLPTYEQVLDSTRAATPGEASVVVEKGSLKEKKI